MEVIKKSPLVFLLIFCFSCKKPVTSFYGNWSWTSVDNKYYEVLIDSSSITGYRHAFLYPREFKITNDTLFLDKINENSFDLRYKIKILSENKIQLLNNMNDLIELNRINKNSFTIDSIKSENDIDRYEMEFTTREEDWKKNKGI